MNHLVVLAEGVADKPLPSFRERTPLEVARMSATSELVRDGRAGMVAKRSALDGEWPRSMLFGMLGLDDEVQRGPCEWAAIGGEPDGATFIYHASLVTVDDGVLDVDAPRLSYEETERLAESLDVALSPDKLRVRPVAAGQLVVAMPWATRKMPELPAVRMAKGKRLVDLLVGVSKEQEVVRLCLDRAAEVLAAHPVNEVRVDLGENPANALWLWGGGWSRESLPTLESAGFVVAASPWVAGAAKLAGWETVGMRALAAMDGDGPAFELGPVVEQMRQRKNCLLYIDSPNILGNFDDPSRKVRGLDQADFYVIRHLRTLMDASRPMRFSLLADSLVRCDTGRPMASALPFAVAGDGIEADNVVRFNETACADGGWGELPFDDVRALVWNEN